MHIPILATPGGAEPGQDARRGEPLTCGVPFPKGLTRTTDGWTLTDGAGVTQLVQARVLDRWADGSIRWALVDTQADVAGGATALSLHVGPNAPPAPPGGPALSVTEAGGGVVVDTGTSRFQLRAGGNFPFDGVVTGDAPVIDSSQSQLTIEDSHGTGHGVRVRSVQIEERGALRVALRLTGTAAIDGGRSLEVSARLHFFAGLSTVRMLITLTNPDAATHNGGFWDLGDPASMLLKDVSLRFRLAGSGPLVVTASPERSGNQWTGYEAPLEIYQDSSGGENWQSSNHVNRERRVPNSFRGYRLRSGRVTSSGLRATPIVHVERHSAQVAATIPHFWENFPKAIEVAGDALVLRLFPGQYGDLHELQGGEQKTHECYVSFGADWVTTMPLAWARARTVTAVAPDWSLSSHAVPFLAPLDAGHAALVNAAVEGPDRLEVKRETIDEYGWRHFGDMYGDHEGVHEPGPPLIVSHYNNQYDPVAGFAWQFLRTGDPRWFQMMTELAAHVADIDVYHTSKDKWTYNHGMFWHTYHYGDADTSTHRCYPRRGLGRIHGGGPSAGHNYTRGLVLHYFLTGDEASRETAVSLADYVIAMDDGRRNVLRWLDRGDTGWAAQSAPRYYGPGRGPANSLIALMDGYQLSGEARFKEKVEQLVRRVIHPADDIAGRNLDVHEERWFYTMFLQALGRFLHWKDELGEHDQIYAHAQAGLLHYARWMVNHTYPYLDKPEKLRYPTETWAAQDIRKSDVFYFAALHSAGEERDRFLERGQFFFRYSVEKLSSMPTKTMTRPVAILLSSGFMQTWRQPARFAYARIAKAEFGQPEQFVAQRERAERRLKWLAAAGAVLAGIAVAVAIVSL